MKDKKIAVLMGGPSSEREVSLRTGKGIANALRDQGYLVAEIDFSPRIFTQQLQEVAPDVVFIALHGKFGEDGAVQGFLDICGIPYTGSGVKTSSVAMDKYLSKELFEAFHIPTPRAGLLQSADSLASNREKVELIGYPVIVKPVSEGSSIGVYKVTTREELEEALKSAFQYGETLLVEEFIQGRELTVAFLDGVGALPVIEIRPHSGEYDYNSKYTKGATEYLVPAPLTKELEEKVLTIAKQVAKVFNSRGVVRLDIMLDDRDETPYVLELNTIPGMTETSLVPQAAAAQGISYGELCELILLKARHDG